MDVHREFSPIPRNFIPYWDHCPKRNRLWMEIPTERRTNLVFRTTFPIGAHFLLPKNKSRYRKLGPDIGPTPKGHHTVEFTTEKIRSG